MNSIEKRDPSGLNGKTNSEESSKDPDAPRRSAVYAFPISFIALTQSLVPI